MASPSQPPPAAAQQQQQARLLYTERVLNESQQDTGVRVLHLNNPDSLNSLTNDMSAEFTAELEQLRKDAAMRALIVTGQVRLWRPASCKLPFTDRYTIRCYLYGHVVSHENLAQAV
jgi:hypothetical protein